MDRPARPILGVATTLIALGAMAGAAAAEDAAAPHPVTFARDFAPEESWVKPMERPARTDLCLDGRWQFQPVPVPESWREGTGNAPELPPPAADRWEATPIKIPSPWNVNTWGAGHDVGPGTARPYEPSSVYFPSYPGTWDVARMGWLRRSVRLPADWGARRAILHFEAVAGEAVVLVNGVAVGRCFDQHLPAEFDVTAALRPGADNELLVGVRAAQLFNLQDARYPHMRFIAPLGSNTDHLVGIWQDVWLVGVPAVHVAEVFMKPYLDRDTLEAEVTVANDTDQAATVQLAGGVQPWSNDAGAGALDAPEPRWHLGAAALRLPGAALAVPAHGRATATLSAAVRGALATWSPAAPRLYGAVITLDGGSDAKYTRFGWRQFAFAGRELRLNGEKLQCFGDLLHPFGPFVTSRRFIWGWYRMMQEAHLNAVRPHAQPWPRCAYDLADEMGVVVLAETGMFGSSIALSFSADAAWANYAAQYDGLVRRQRNNPSVVGWSFGNELFAIFALNHVAPDDDARWRAQLAELGLRARALDPTRSWISCDGDEDLGGALPVWSKHYGHGVPALPALDKPQMVGESGGTYYAEPKLMAAFNGDRAYACYAGRAEALAIDVYQDIVQMARPKLAWYSASELAWFGIEHLPLGWRDASRLPDGRDGVFPAQPYAEGRPGMQVERIPPYVSTINPGWDPGLPLYRPTAMFTAMQAALDPAGPRPCAWDHRTATGAVVAAAPAPTITRVAFAGAAQGVLARRLRTLGVPFSADAAAPLLVVDGASAAQEPALAARAAATLQAGGTVLLAVGAGVDAAADALLPPGVTVVERRASQLVAEPGAPLAAGLSVPALAFYDLEDDPQVVKRVVDGPGLAVALRPANTDWSLFVRHGEAGKCAAMLLYEALQKPAGAVLASVARGGGRLVLVSLDPALRAAPVSALWTRVLGNCGIALRPPLQTWLVGAAATPGAAAPIWRYTTSAPGAEWAGERFDDGAWASGEAGFGTPVPGVAPATPWTGADIWLGRGFDLAAPVDEATVVAYWDEEGEVWINGTKVMDLPGFTTSYHALPLDDRARAALHPGRNVIAVHCRNLAGGQFIDLGIVTGAAAGGPAHGHDLLLDGPLGE